MIDPLNVPTDPRFVQENCWLDRTFDWIADLPPMRWLDRLVGGPR